RRAGGAAGGAVRLLLARPHAAAGRAGEGRHPLSGAGLLALFQAHLPARPPALPDRHHPRQRARRTRRPGRGTTGAVMRVLVIKTSSLGDVIHTLPALTDAARALPGARFDWVAEENFAEIPAWHPAVDTVIPVALRRWRRAPLKAWRSGEWRAMKQAIAASPADVVIDAQELIKSALLTRYASAPVHGLDRASVREPFAARFYDSPHTV